MHTDCLCAVVVACGWIGLSIVDCGYLLSSATPLPPQNKDLAFECLGVAARRDQGEGEVESNGKGKWKRTVRQREP